jgi:hypothetical protein
MRANQFLWHIRWERANAPGLLWRADFEIALSTAAVRAQPAFRIGQ